MKWSFWKKSSPSIAAAKPANADFIQPQRAERLLKTERRAVLIDLIWEQTSMSRPMFQKLYLTPISRYAELVQEFPASESHHHAYPGGLLDHGLELMLNALRLRQSYLLPSGAAPEDQSQQAEAWTAGCAYGGLLHDVAKPACDLIVELSDGSIWHMWDGVITKPYRFRYRTDRDYHLHNSAVGLVYNRILDPEILTWLSKYRELWRNFIHLLAGDYGRAEVLGEIVSKADRISTAQNVGANPEKAAKAPINSIQRQMLNGLQHLIKHEFKLNQPGAQAWLTQDSLWLMSKIVSDKLRAYLLSQGFDGVPTKNSVLFDEMQSHGLVETTSDGKAIWKAEIKDDEWVQEFTFLRMKPSLIWPNEEMPARFGGVVTPIAGEVNNSDNSDETPAAVPTSTPAASQTAQNVSESCGVVSQNQTIVSVQDDSVDDVMNLFSDMQSSGSEAASETDETPDQKQEVVKTSPQSASEANLKVGEKEPSKKKAPKTFPKTLDDMEVQTRRQLAEDFFEWLKTSLKDNKLAINDTSAKIHIVESQVLLVTPGIFQRFCLEQSGHEDDETWRKVQKGFEKLKLHKKLPNDHNIWTCEVRGPRKGGRVIKGYLIETNHFFENPPMDNPFLILRQ